MKLQHLAIIFVIIMLPISMVITSYIQAQIDTISLQTTYSTKLQTATHDAIKAFQLNTLNNKYSSLADSKIRDIEASISTFYNSLGTELGASGYDAESLQAFIPAIVYTMYDGYYIYGKYYNDNIGDYQYGLKPYIYYSCRYINGNTDVVINYTLDNNITVCGKVKGIYQTKSGVLVDPSKVSYISDKSLKYGDTTIEPEVLSEQLVILDENGNSIQQKTPDTYEYTVYGNQKIYLDKNPTEFDDNYFKYNGWQYFTYVSNKKNYVTNNSDTNEELRRVLEYWTYNGHLHCNSAIEYYKNAKIFSDWVYENLDNLTQEDAVDSEGNPITDFTISTENSPIFKFDKNSNDPMQESSIFNQNRVSVIRRTIQSTLNTAIANYSSSANYEFALPIFTEEDWDKLVNNISVASFMQGIPIGSKYFNNYCIITNNKNKEFVTKDSIYIITEDNVAHKASSRHVIDNKEQVKTAYRNIDFESQTVVGTTETYTYYPHANERCYECVVNYADVYDIDDIIAGKIQKYNEDTKKYEKDSTATSNLEKTNLIKVYLTALAREKQNLYKTNSYFGT